MPEIVELIAPSIPILARIQLPASKSISNRMLILEAISDGLVKGIDHSNADDTQILKRCLEKPSPSMHVGAGGTTLRFLLAYLASKPDYTGEILGSDRLMQRPIDSLIQALTDLGATISKEDIDGSTKLRVKGTKLRGGTVHLAPSESSQFATALLLIAPSMELGLDLFLPKDFPSRKYLDMTLALMQQCGFKVSQTRNHIRIEPGMPLKKCEITIEKDWSSASYWFGIAALMTSAKFTLPGLNLNSIQTDSIAIHIFSFLGVKSTVIRGELVIEKSSKCVEQLGIDVSDFPDLFPTIAMVCAGLRMKCLFTGLKTLRVKESDRIAAICSELEKMKVKHNLLNLDLLEIDGRQMLSSKTVVFESHDDHRLAMSCAMVSAVIWKVVIRDPHVVSKSFPAFWTELSSAGFGVREFES
jgi:3-phosphoshikimate 1-carboxyvinyltransferase